MRAGVIDIGTNTVRLLVADLAGGRLSDVERSLTFARLGEGVDEARTLSDAAMTRAVDAISNYATRWRELGCDVTRAIATSAVRDASNRDDFVARVADRTGVRVEVISGDEEARLAFTGATADRRGTSIVFDIGGGSTEIVRGRDGSVLDAVSLDIGAVRLTERHVRLDPPTSDELAAVRAAAASAIAGVSFGSADRLIGVAGTVTTLAVLALGLPAYDHTRVQGATLSRAKVLTLLDGLAEMTSEQRRGLPSVAGREDVIVAGAIIADAVMEGSGFDLCAVSGSDILDGTALVAGAQESERGSANA